MTADREPDPRGFAGLATMVSDVSADVEAMRARAQAASRAPEAPPPTVPPPLSHRRWLGGVVLLAIVTVLGILAWLVAAPAAPRLREDAAPVGREHVLELDRIRSCLAEKIRLDAVDGVVDPQSEQDVQRFNARVTWRSLTPR